MGQKFINKFIMGSKVFGVEAALICAGDQSGMFYCIQNAQRYMRHLPLSKDTLTDLIFMLRVCRRPPWKASGEAMIPFKQTPCLRQDLAKVSTLTLCDGFDSL